MNKINERIKRMAILLRSIPVFVTIIFIVTVISMNLLAKITIVSLPWIALNAGISISWLSFLILDVVTKHFGAKASNILSMIAMLVNLISSGILFILSLIFHEKELDLFLGGAWSILAASSIAFILSALTNNYMNVFVGKKLINKVSDKSSFTIRTLISTFFGQVVDNFIFVFLAFMVFPLIPRAAQVHWTFFQCLGCSVTCAILELISELIFTPFGYKIAKKWQEKNVGMEYIEKYNQEKGE